MPHQSREEEIREEFVDKFIGEMLYDETDCFEVADWFLTKRKEELDSLVEEIKSKKVVEINWDKVAYNQALQKAIEIITQRK